MLAHDYYHFKNGLNQKGIIFSFTGYVSEELVYALGETLKRKMTIEEADTSLAKKVFSIFVEQIQNIIRYSDERVVGAGNQEMELKSGMISVGLENNMFFVVCGNIVDQQRVIMLKDRLEYLASLDKKGIKAYYREKLKEPFEGNQAGANIGLIEIARRASQPVEFDFLPVNEAQSFFCLKAYI